MNVSICLAMIVKNESKIIERLLESVLPIIDSYCICDTGSDDDTIEKITNYFKNKKQGKIISEPFINFEYNRNFVIHEAKKMNTSHILVMDADMKLEIGNSFDKKMLSENDIYFLYQGTSSFFYKNVRIFKNHPEIKYVGVTHEYVSYPNHFSSKLIEKDSLFILDIGDGGCKQNKFQRDILLLEKETIQHPNEPRSWFYLANSYRDTRQFENAIRCYQERIKLGGWDQEVWSSWYSIGNCYFELNQPEKAISAMLSAFEVCNKRFENIHRIIRYYRENSKNKLANFFYQQVQEILKKYPSTNQDFLFYEADVISYKLDYEFSIIAYYNDYRNIEKAIVSIYKYCHDENIRSTTLKNLEFYDHYLRPSNLTNFTCKPIKEFGNRLYQNCTSSSMSICDYNETQYLMNIRIVNYSIFSDGNYELENNLVLTWNEARLLNKETLEVDSKLELLEPKAPFIKRINGLEDLRVYQSVVDQSFYYLATMMHKDDRIKMVHGKYNIKEKTIEQPYVLLWKEKIMNECEKNWTHFIMNGQDYFIYQWYPLQILYFTNQFIDKDLSWNNIQYVELYKEIPTSLFFKDIRGSTNGYTFNNEIWFVTHKVSYQTPRHYYHCIVVFEKDTMKLLRHTSLLKLSKSKIEYCLGIIVNEKEVLLCVSEWDRTSHILRYDKQYIENKMFLN